MIPDAPVDEAAFNAVADGFRQSAEKALKAAYLMHEPDDPLTFGQHALAAMTGCLTAAIGEFARLETRPGSQPLGLLAVLHRQVDLSWEDAMRLLSEGQA